MSLEMIALDRLVPAKQNVRVAKVSRDSQAALMASIAAEGVLQNLVVVPQGEQFAVIAGGRRLQALRGLVAAGDIAEDYPVPCAVRGSEAQMIAISLAENFQRDAMLGQFPVSVHLLSQPLQPVSCRAVAFYR